MDVNPQKTTIGCLGPLPLHKVYAFDQCVPGLHCRHPTQSQAQTKRLGFDPVIYGISSQKRQSFDEIKPGMLANVGVLKQSQLALHLEKSKLHVWTPDRLGLPGIAWHPRVEKTSPEVQFPPKLIADLKQSFPSPSQIQAFTWPLAMQGKDHLPLKSQGRNKINEAAIFHPHIQVQVRSEVSFFWLSTVLSCPLQQCRM